MLFSRAPLILDILFLAMLAFLPLLLFSVYLVRIKKKFLIHKRLQIGLTVALMSILIAFEIEMRLNGWRQYTDESPYNHTTLMPFLLSHIAIASATLVFWIVTFIHGLKKIALPPIQSPSTSIHKNLAWISVIGLTLTTLTGWIFYYMAFIAINTHT